MECVWVVLWTLSVKWVSWIMQMKLNRNHRDGLSWALFRPTHSFYVLLIAINCHDSFSVAKSCCFDARYDGENKYFFAWCQGISFHLFKFRMQPLTGWKTAHDNPNKWHHVTPQCVHLSPLLSAANPPSAAAATDALLSTIFTWYCPRSGRLLSLPKRLDVIAWETEKYQIGDQTRR